jgi:hypothetical protein
VLDDAPFELEPSPPPQPLRSKNMRDIPIVRFISLEMRFFILSALPIEFSPKLLNNLIFKKCANRSCKITL